MSPIAVLLYQVVLTWAVQRGAFADVNRYITKLVVAQYMTVDYRQVRIAPVRFSILPNVTWFPVDQQRLPNELEFCGNAVQVYYELHSELINDHFQRRIADFHRYGKHVRYFDLDFFFDFLDYYRHGFKGVILYLDFHRIHILYFDLQR